MLDDAAGVADGIALRTAVCVIGGGPAGITVARELDRAGVDTILLESGGEEEEPETQQLAAGHNLGMDYFPLDETRFRVLGGSSNRWAGWCRPLDPLDFEPRGRGPDDRGWPLGYETLAPYYRRALELCELGNVDFDESPGDHRLPDLYRDPLADPPLRRVFWHGSPPTKFGRVYRRPLAESRHVRVLLHANAVTLETDADGHRVEHVQVRTLAGKRFNVYARAFVLTAGAIETARLLLNSTTTHAAGLGNRYDNVGRYFMEHPHVVSGRLLIARNGRDVLLPSIDRGITGIAARLSLRRPAGGFRVAFSIAPEVQRKEGLLNWAAHLTPPTQAIAARSEGYESLKLLVSNMRSAGGTVRQIRRRQLPEGVGGHLMNVVRDSGTLARFAYHELLSRPSELEVFSQCEQVPNRDSRVTLTDDLDALGQPRVALDWRLSAQDKDSLLRSQQLLSDSLERAGIGHVVAERWLLDGGTDWGSDLRGGHHHLGTARMNEDPKSGVVDRDCRVHDVSNLYIADGSVFPSAGFANPMLTILANALRVAELVASRGHSPSF